MAIRIPFPKCLKCEKYLTDRRNKVCRKCVNFYYSRKATSTSFKKGHKVLGGFKKGNKIMLGRKMSESAKEKISQWHIANPNKKFKDTGIELKIEQELKNRNIQYEKQVSLCKIAVVDFYLPEYRIIIQCDGNYWHNFPDGRDKDKKQDLVLTFNGFNVYRFWETEINKSPKDCINKIFE